MLWCLALAVGFIAQSLPVEPSSVGTGIPGWLIGIVGAVIVGVLVTVMGRAGPWYRATVQRDDGLDKMLETRESDQDTIKRVHHILPTLEDMARFYSGDAASGTPSLQGRLKAIEEETRMVRLALGIDEHGHTAIQDVLEGNRRIMEHLGLQPPKKAP